MQVELLTPAGDLSPDEIYKRYPSRELAKNALVTRIAPSPTGFMHIGGLYAALVSQRLARQSHGVFFLRIEDTDKKREVDGAVDLIVTSLQIFGLAPDEGEIAPGVEIGRYAPYRQSERKPLYQSFVRHLLAEGKAYPCFAEPAELEQLREEQTALKVSPGYYGRWAPWRGRSDQDVNDALAAGKPFVIRLKTPENQPEQITLFDLIRGELTFPPNQQDTVLLKADGMPTYHLAHVVDDRLMGTTDVIRGHEWLSSYPLHAQLFDLFGWPPPRYAHISPIEKMAGSSRRKLSKRHDPEASVEFYRQQGYPVASVIEYLLTLVDGKFEDWCTAHPDADIGAFNVDLQRMSRSGALFDLVKLDSISRDNIGRMSASAVFEAALEWAGIYDLPLAALLGNDPDYGKAILGIERNRERVRKDIAKWSEVSASVCFFYDELFADMAPQVSGLLVEQRPVPSVETLREIAAGYDVGRSHDEWLDWLREIGGKYAYAPSAKAFKQDPHTYRGHFGDLAGSLRIALSGRKITPDLYEVMQVLGKDRVQRRIDSAIAMLSRSSPADCR